MFTWSKYPLVRILVAFICGIIFKFSFPAIVFPVYIILIFIIISFLLVLLFAHRDNILWHIGAILILINIALTGFAYTQIFIQYYSIPADFDNEAKQVFVATVEEPPTQKPKSIKLTTSIRSIYKDSLWHPCHYKAIIYLATDSLSQQIEYGDKILINSRLNRIEANKNPHAFDYVRYLRIKNIYLQSYCTENQWTKLAAKQGNPIMATAIHIRSKFLKIFEEARMDMREYGVIAAILLGYDDKLDPDLQKSYSSAGASHILCVSGMHVGIIFMIVNFFLKFLDKKRWQKILKASILLFTIWFYACITGLSPSVLRAATMFSFISFGGMLQQRTNTYNSLFASMLFLLIFNPLLIFEVGFQLSYAAVLGIVWLQRPLYQLYVCRTKIGDYVWNLITVSIAAQLFTAPIAMYYFHQFPNYFIFTNIIVIGLAFVVVCLGIAVLAFAFWPLVYKCLAMGLTYLIRFMNMAIEFIESLPFSTTQGISFSLIETILIYIFIICFAAIWLYKRKDCIFFAAIVCIVFLSLEIKTQLQIRNTSETIVYSTHSTPIIDSFYKKSCHTYLFDTLALSDMYFATENNRIYHRINSLYCEIGQNPITINHKTYLQLKEKLYPTNQHIIVDYLIIADNQHVYNLAQIKQMISFDKLLLGGNLYEYRKQQLIQQCDSLQIIYHNLKDSCLIVK